MHQTPTRRASTTTLAVFLIIGLQHAVLAQSSRPSTPDRGSEVSLEQVMAHPEWLGRPPLRFYWGDLDRSIYFERAKPTVDGVDYRTTELWRVALPATRPPELEQLTPERVEPDQRLGASFANGTYDRQRQHKVFIRDGDVYWRDLATGTTHQLTRTEATERSPQFLLDGRIAYWSNGTLLAQDTGSGLLEELLTVRFEDEPLAARDKAAEKAGYLGEQQQRLFDWIQDQDARGRYAITNDRDERRRDPTRSRPPFYLGKDRARSAATLSPSGDVLLLTTTETDADEGRHGLMPHYVTASGYVETEEVRVKAGDLEQPPETLWLIRADAQAPFEVDLSTLPGIFDDPLAELRVAAKEREAAKKQAAEKKRGETGAKPDDQTDAKAEAADEEATKKARGVIFDGIELSDDGAVAVVHGVSEDNKDRWIAAVDLQDGTLRPLHHMHDPAWINWSFRDLGFLPGSHLLYFLSEESGYSQLYVLDPTAKQIEARRLTHGDFVVDHPTPSADGAYLYYTANAEHPSAYDVYRVRNADGAVERLTRLGGLTDYQLSESGDRLLLRHSTSIRPPELFVQDARPDAIAYPVTATASDTFLAMPWREPAIVEVPSSHVERPIVSRLYLPAKPASAGAKRPAVLFVHGAGYLQDAHAGWSGYFREFMFHTLLTQRGYVVLDMDYRGSAGYGRDWRTAIYRQMGHPEVEDLEDGVRYLVAQHAVDPARVGVYGGSYGGFLTLMSMFRAPKLFAAGAALRPVTDWAHYNHPYTSNILNTPAIDPEAYERSSPIEFADGLEKPLLIATGMLDDNVFFQDSVRLVQKLIELEKQDWVISIYPVEHHGFLEPASWLNEYRRILKLFETHLRAAATPTP